MNVDHKEIEKFSALAHRWWDPEGEMKPLHDINPLRLDFIRQHTDGLVHKQVLDVGCGAGILSEALAAEGAAVTGIDLAEESIEVARLHLYESSLQVDYHTVSVEQFAQDHGGCFDVLTCMEMLEHVPDPDSVVRACARLVKPGGKLFFSTINRNLKSYVMAILGAEYILKLIPQGTHQYERFIRPGELYTSLEQADCTTLATTGIHYNPLTRHYKLGSNIDVNYLLCAQRDEHERHSV